MVWDGLSLTWPIKVPFGKYILNTFFLFCVCSSRVSAFLGFCFWTLMGPWVFPFVLTHCCSGLYTAWESSTGRILYSSPAYPPANLSPGVRFVLGHPTNADTLQLHLAFFFFAVCVCLYRASVFHWVFVVNHNGSLGFSLAFTYFGSLCVTKWESHWEHLT